MSSTTLPAPEGPTSPTISSRDHSDLAELGYEQQLHRKLGKFASFAAGFSFVSILTTIFQLFALGFSFGGPAFFFTWPLVFLGQFMVALNFAELAARYPISGAIYQWSRRMGGEIVGWFAGWFMIIAQIVTASAAAIALQVVLPSIWSGFQLVGDDLFVTNPERLALGLERVDKTPQVGDLSHCRILCHCRSVGDRRRLSRAGGCGPAARRMQRALRVGRRGAT